MSTSMDIREPAVAGLFYPNDARELAGTVDRLIVDASPTTTAAPVRMLLVPHAGYAYSGAIAGRGFSRLRATGAPSRAFIIGPSHVEVFDFTSVYGGRAYRTPLGDVPVDGAAAALLAAATPSIRIGDAGHALPRHGRGEHGIEVELPFLQCCFPDILVVPIVMGDQSWRACEELGHAIAKIVDWTRDVVIASSDLSHFYTDQQARTLDGIFCDTLASLDARTLFDRVSRRECEACGAGPVIASLMATQSLDHRGYELTGSGNSSDTTEDRSSVVGYASAVVTGDPAPEIA
jgi:MEMO1 family protein